MASIARVPKVARGYLCFSPCGGDYVSLLSCDYNNIWAIKQKGTQGTTIDCYEDSTYIYFYVAYGNPITFIGGFNEILNIDTITAFPSGATAITIKE